MVRVSVLGFGLGMRDRKVKSRDCALASDLVRAVELYFSTARLRACIQAQLMLLKLGKSINITFRLARF